MLVRCQACDNPLTEVLPNEGELKVCRQCYELNKSEVQNIERQQLLR